ncbi:putative calcineurin subunit B [Monocercomonoides exilis]|uniref:putative calcineurin subunit B n=1 Tax=Monocercomonoides exilis TaxID=2049356 RepID=UPI00355A3DE5|nr:putative calcineurin subunit B [Monocercomonoides exilis]
MNPLHTRILSIFEKNKDERVDFRSFVSCLDVLSKGTKEEKISVAFRIYDFDGDGYISINDFLAVLKMMVGKHLQDEPASHVAEKTIHQYDKDNDEKLSETEFEDAMEGTDIENQLTITVS